MITVTCTRDDCDLIAVVDDRDAAERVGSAHYKHEGHPVQIR